MPDVQTTTLDPVDVNAPAPTTVAQPSLSSPNFNPYTKRIISVTFQLNATSGQTTNTSFGGGDTLTLTGLRTFVQVQHATISNGGGATGDLYLRIYGMTLAHINTLTKAGTTYLQGQNVVQVQAGDVDGALTTIFTGQINYAYPEFSHQPDTAFVVQASSTGELQLKPAKPVSFPGPTSAEQALTQILKPSGITVQNNGVNATLASPYFPGTVWQQVQRIVKAANAVGHYDALGKKMIIWPKGGGSTQGSTVLIAPSTGMIGYPQFQQNQIVVRTIFAPNTLTTPSQQIKVESQLASAQGLWTAYQVTYNLSSEAPGGPWEMIITAAPNKMAGGAQ